MGRNNGATGVERYKMRRNIVRVSVVIFCLVVVSPSFGFDNRITHRDITEDRPKMGPRMGQATLIKVRSYEQCRG